MGKQQQSDKVKHIVFSNIDKPQSYLSSSKLNNTECSLLFNLRCQTVKDIKDNFPSMYARNVLCQLCNDAVDTQKHLLQCAVLSQHIPINPSIKYEHIFGDIDQQHKVTILISAILEVRDKLLGEGAGLTRQISSGPRNMII